MTASPPQTLSECLKSAGGGDDGGGGDDDPGVAAAEVAAFLVERVSSLSDASSSSSSASLASLLDEVASSLRSGGIDALILDAGVFDWSPKLLGVADEGEAAEEKEKADIADDGDRDRAPSTSLSSSPSPVAIAVHRLASALAAHLSPREALALFSAEMASTRRQAR